MNAFTPVSGRLGRWMWTPMVVAGLIGISGCKNTSNGTGATTGWPIGGAPQGADPLFGAAPPPSAAPPAGLTPAGHSVTPTTGAPLSGTQGAVPPPPPSGPLPGFHAPATMGSPAALATGTTGTLANPRDPLAANNASAPTLIAPITNTPVNSVPGGPQPILLNPVATTPTNTYPQPAATPPPSPSAFGNTPAPVGSGPTPSGPLPVPGSSAPPPPDPVPGGASSKPVQPGTISLAGYQQNFNQQINQATSKVNATTNQLNQSMANYQLQAQTNLTQLQDQLRSQGTVIDQSSQAAIANLNNSLSQQGMMWQKMQKQADGSWKSMASFADPNNPTNRRTMEAVASTPEGAMRALLGEAQSVR